MITDELRKYARGYELMVNHKLLEIADRIDAEHEKACDDAWDNGYEADYLGIENWLIEHQQVMEHHGWVELPKDADGEHIRIGDKVTCGASVWEVTGFRFTGGFWGICCTIFFDQGGSGTNVYPPSDLHHHRASTVEDVLREFVDEFNRDDTELCDGEIIERFAAKLRLAGDAE